MTISAPPENTGGTMRLLNFGCGGTFHPDWVNLDTSPVSPAVILHDLKLPFPFGDRTFDAVYGSHVIEHLEPASAQRLLQGCFRILKPGGIIRLVVPDLEAIARLYLSSLDGALDAVPDSEMRYDWSMLELYDQTVRKVSGGKMAAYLAGHPAGGRPPFIAGRIGCEGTPSATGQSSGFSASYRLSRKLRSLIHSSREAAAIAFVFLFLGRRGEAALREGLFRNGGEVHQWMYDRFSMARALGQAGFSGIENRAAGESGIPRFATYHLEVVNGSERKPYSLYMEARRDASPDPSGTKRLVAS